MSDVDFEYGRVICECGNDTFQVVFNGLPVTPSPIAVVMLRCDKCGTEQKIETRAKEFAT